MNGKVLVAMSGGVDSSVAALLLQRQGYEVGGATYVLFDGAPESNVRDAREICARLGVPHHVLDYRSVFSEKVLDYFVGGYAAGETPNPCVACNRAIKFGVYLEDAARLGYRYVSTGHYAGVRFDGESGLYQLLRSTQERKDQSYMLYHLTQEQLSRLLLPIDRYGKEEVRALAAEAGLAVVQSKSDSQDICFVPDGDYVSFITRRTGKVPAEGDYIDDEGRVIGRHKGVPHYTIGQRRGLGVSFGAHRFVSALDPAANTVTLSEESALFHNTLFANDLRMIAPEAPARPFRAQAKIRYAHRPAPALVCPLAGGAVRVEFDAPQRAVTPGQAVVFYDGGRVLGGATIRRAEDTAEAGAQ